MSRRAESSTQLGVGALAAGVCALGLSMVGIGAPATASAAPSDSSSSAAEETPSRAANAPSTGPAPTSRTNPGRRAVASTATAQPGPAISPGAAASDIRRQSAAPATELRQPDISATLPQAAPSLRRSPLATLFLPAGDVVVPDVQAVPRGPTALTAPVPSDAGIPLPAATTLTASVARVAPAAATPTPLPTPATPYAAVASGRLNAIATGNPAPVGDVTLPTGSVSEFISGIMQLTRRWFFNSTPTAESQQALMRPNGQTWGFLTASDAEGEQIDYAISKNPNYGTVSVTPSGVYTYTPGAGFTGTDSFTVTLTNPGFHINLLNPFDAQRRDLTIKVAAPGPDSGTVVDNFGGAAGSAPDPAHWGYHLGPYQDAGLQTYTQSPENVRLDGQGNLVIQALKTADGYTSTRLVTQDKLSMQYGSVQARIKMPSGQGIWPAFWTLGTSYYPSDPAGWPGCGEIDIMELVNTGNMYTVALHGPQGSTDYYGGSAASNQFVGTQGPISEVSPISDLTADFHDYWTIWREDHIVVGVDGTTLAEFTPDSLPPGGQWVFNAPMYTILQIAVGGPWPGPPDATTPWPATMLVDSFQYTPLRQSP